MENFTGNFGSDSQQSIALRKMKIGYKQELQVGPASILCNVGDGVKEYDAKITRIDYEPRGLQQKLRNPGNRP